MCLEPCCVFGGMLCFCNVFGGMVSNRMHAMFLEEACLASRRQALILDLEAPPLV